MRSPASLIALKQPIAILSFWQKMAVGGSSSERSFRVASKPEVGVQLPSATSWSSFAIASVVVGGTLLTGGSGSVGATLAGALLHAMVFNILNFENGLGRVSLSAYWQSVIRGAFLLVVVILQAKLMTRRKAA